MAVVDVGWAFFALAAAKKPGARVKTDRLHSFSATVQHPTLICICTCINLHFFLSLFFSFFFLSSFVPRVSTRARSFTMRGRFILRSFVLVLTLSFFLYLGIGRVELELYLFLSKSHLAAAAAVHAACAAVQTTTTSRWKGVHVCIYLVLRGARGGWLVGCLVGTF